MSNHLARRAYELGQFDHTDMLTEAEQAALRRSTKEASAAVRKAGTPPDDSGHHWRGDLFLGLLAFSLIGAAALAFFG